MGNEAGGASAIAFALDQLMVGYLAEFELRFIHRFNLSAMFDSLGRGFNTKPAPYWWLKMAYYGAQSGMAFTAYVANETTKSFVLRHR